jgi:hypothetical protein
MNLQTRYDLEIAEDKIAAKVERDVQPLETVAARQCTKSPATKAPALRLPTVAKIQMFRVSRPAELLGRPGRPNFTLRILIGTSPTANCCQASAISTKVRAVQIVLLF